MKFFWKWMIRLFPDNLFQFVTSFAIGQHLSFIRKCVRTVILLHSEINNKIFTLFSSSLFSKCPVNLVCMWSIFSLWNCFIHWRKKTRVWPIKIDLTTISFLSLTLVIPFSFVGHCIPQKTKISIFYRRDIRASDKLIIKK